METYQTRNTNLFEGGKEEFEGTREFVDRVAEVKRQLQEKYSPALLKERNWIKRLYLRAKMSLEQQRKIREISSMKNLHILTTSN